MSLQVGDKAPQFTLKSKNLSGDVKDISLTDFTGKNLVILFYPQSFTGVCTNEMCVVSDGLNEYTDIGSDVIAISVDSVFTQEAWSKVNNIKIPLLSDFNRKVIELYGTKYSDGGFVHDMNGVSKRAAFVIDKTGIVRYAEILESAGDLPDFDAIKDTLKSL